MGDLAEAGPSDRASTRQLAAAILEAVRADGNVAEAAGLHEARTRGGRMYGTRDVDSLLVQMAQEVEALRAESDRLFSALDEALGLADVPEHMQDEEWNVRRKACGATCDEFVGFRSSP